MLRGILIAVLAVGVAGTAFWGYQEHKEKNVILLNAENIYQRSFHDLTYQIDLLNDKIGTTLAMNSKKSLSPALADVWRITSEAQNDVGQLPLTLLPFNKTEEFLSKIGDFSYKAAVRDLDKAPLDKKEYKKLQDLYKQSADIQQELRKVQYLVLENNLRWMDVELALASGKEAADNSIIDGFKLVEKKVSGYSEASEMGPTNLSSGEKNQAFKNLKGKEISKQEAIDIAKRFAKVDGSKVKVEENGKGSQFGFYSVSLQNPKSKIEANLDITKKGGYPVWFINNRQVKTSKLSLNDATNKATEFLKENKFSSLDLFESTQYDNIAMLNFVTIVDNVRVYPDSVKIKVALDDGSIIGFSANDYLKSNKVRQMKTPSISADEARQYISQNVNIMENRLAIIVNDIGEEVLCHEFMGVIGDDTYRIFINADTAQEEKVDKLQNAEPVYENMI
ncbi:germination protein YpeB [Peribacillus alkalitolerans]|uniref:germination protein YpeB n=1 Tax=Peribacillus alkalitolerans TaxID=1550385 RepID=UPI0013D1831C|nr:germination protein YpeB [Peribacillus alkalitolerans]